MCDACDPVPRCPKDIGCFGPLTCGMLLVYNDEQGRWTCPACGYVEPTEQEKAFRRLLDLARKNNTL